MTTEAPSTTEAAVEAPEAPTAVALSYEDAAKQVWDEGPVTDTIATTEAPAVEAPPVEAAMPEPAQDPKIARRITAATRAEIRAAKERAELRAEREAIDRAKAELAQREAEYNLIDEDPVRFFEVKKKDPKVFLEKLAGEYKPESIQSKELAALRAELAELKQQQTQAQQTAKQRAEQAQYQAAWQEASTEFVAFVGETAEKYPHLVAEYTEQEAVAEAYRALHEVVGHDGAGRPVTRNEAYFQQFGMYPDNDVIAEHLDAQAKARAEARQKSAWRTRVEAASGASQASPNGDPNPKAPPVIKGLSPRTLTSRAASEKAAPPKQWTQEAADEESLRILQHAFK